jgi:hypothetical protein
MMTSIPRFLRDWIASCRLFDCGESESGNRGCHCLLFFYFILAVSPTVVFDGRMVVGQSTVTPCETHNKLSYTSPCVGPGVQRSGGNPRTVDITLPSGGKPWLPFPDGNWILSIARTRRSAPGSTFTFPCVKRAELVFCERG